MNKTEISKETKAKVFAQYLGQITTYQNFCLDPSVLHDVLIGRDIKLLLTPLSKITDEDAIEVVKIMDPNAKDIYLSNGTIHWEYEFVGEMFESAIEIGSIPLATPFASCQYLQSRGYDLPNYHLNGQTLIEANLALDKTLIK